MAGRSAARTRRRTRPHHDLRRPSAGHRGPTAIPGVRGCRPDRHQRRAGSDRRRHDRRDGGPLLWPRTRVGRRTRGHHRRHPEEADATPRRRRLRGGDGGESQAGHGSGGRRNPHPGRHRAGRRGAGHANGRRAARAAARTAADVGQRGGDARRPAGDRRPDGVPAGDRPDVRPARVRAGGDAARRRTVRQRLRAPGDHHLPAPRRVGDRHAVRARRRRRLHAAGRPAARTPRPGALLRRRCLRRRPGRGTAGGSHHRDGRIVHRGHGRGPADGPARVVRLRRRRRGLLFEPGQDGSPRCRPRAARGQRGGIRARRRGHGRGCAEALRRGHRGGDHRDRRSRWRNAPTNPLARSASASCSATARR